LFFEFVNGDADVRVNRIAAPVAECHG
jgi:hypothetical protein